MSQSCLCWLVERICAPPAVISAREAVQMRHATIVYNPSARPEMEGGQKKIYRGEIVLGRIREPCVVARPRAGYSKGMAEEVKLWKVLSSPGHTNLLKLYHFFSETSVIAMELVDPIGFDLVSLGTQYQHSGRRRMPVAETADVFRQLARALRYMHAEKGILHRDLKADQVLLTQAQQVKLTDFGLAARIGDLRRFPRMRPIPRDPGGTSNIAPEIPHCECLHPRMYGVEVDLFGLGWILLQLYGTVVPPRSSAAVSEATLQEECGGNADAHLELLDLVETAHLLTREDPAGRLTLDQLEGRAWMQAADQDDEVAAGSKTAAHGNRGGAASNTAADRDERGAVSKAATAVAASLPRIPRTGSASSGRRLLRRFGRRLVAASALLVHPFPKDGMTLRQISSEHWTCLLIERPTGSFETFPAADTLLKRGERIFFGCKGSVTTEVTCTSYQEARALHASLSDEGRLTADVSVGGQQLLKGHMLSGEGAPAKDATLTYTYDPKLELSRRLQLNLSSELERSETYQALTPFSLEFDAFEFPEGLVGRSAVLGPSCFATDQSQRALNFRASCRINLAGIARPGEAGLEVEWMPGPRSVVTPGCLGLVVRRPTSSGVSLPTITDEDLISRDFGSVEVLD